MPESVTRRVSLAGRWISPLIPNFNVQEKQDGVTSTFKWNGVLLSQVKSVQAARQRGSYGLNDAPTKIHSGEWIPRTSECDCIWTWEL